VKAPGGGVPGTVNAPPRRDPEKRELLLELALRRIEKAERDNFTIIGARRRRVRIG